LREALPIDDRGLSGPVGEFFAPIAAAWRFTAAQRARLAPVVETALNTGWTPTELAAFTGGSTDGVRNPYAVLAARLSSAELPARTATLVRRVRRADPSAGLRRRRSAPVSPVQTGQMPLKNRRVPRRAARLQPKHCTPAEITEAKDHLTRDLRR